MDGLFFASAVLGSLVLFTLAALSRPSGTRDRFDGFDGFDEGARPIVRWTHHD